MPPRSSAPPQDALRLDVFADFVEENWPSMDLVAEMLVQSATQLEGVRCRLLRPSLWRLPHTPSGSALARGVGRFVQYPLFAASERGTRACFHVADHSYAHLVHHLPRGSTGVYCHDADAFRALREPREQLTRRCMARWTLAGLRRASVIFYSTEVVRAELLSSGLLTNERLVHAPYGCSSEFDPTPTPLDDETRRRYGSEVLLHVGSCVPRKNTEFLLRFFADWRTRQPNAQLVQVGGTWPAAQLSLMRQLQIEKSVTQLRGVNRHQLAALYRQSQALLLPSSSEGFGLPLIEGLACGARVVASDIPVLREVGGAAARYAPISELDAWIRELRAALAAPRDEHRRAAQERAATYSWKRHAQTIVGEYRRLAKAGPAANHGGSS